QELSPDLSEPAPQPQSYYAMGPDDQQIRVVERDIMYPGATGPIRFSVAAVTTENDQEVSAFVWVMGWALGLFGVGLLVALVVQVRYGLRPLRDVQTALGDVRSGDAERLEGQFPQEIEPVVDELNALIDHNAEIVARARTHVGNLAHALKTPISVLSNEADADDTDLGQSVRKQVDVMRRHVDHYLVRARAAGTGGIIGARTPLLPVLESLGNTLSRIYAEKRLKFSVSADSNLRFRGERQDLEEMLGNLMDNAAKWARQHVAVAAERAGGELLIHIDDDGPGISRAKREAVFARGERLDEAVAGSGLGLSIVRDIAGLYGGRIELGDSSLGGLSATLVLPAAADTSVD
ncbi:MAG: sensor histidine kinase, partial [Alphaproteobacteria bacterium]|nr:sensor histidine kinase [Alphaproteobacteria bacterium]